MPVRMDPEERETAALAAMAPDLADRRVLEVGCGDGRLTWRYAARAGRVLAIDPDRDWIALAREDLPPALAGRVELRATGVEELDARDASFDAAIMSWSL